MCCILEIIFIFVLALPTGKFPLWHQGSMPWNTKVSDEGVGKTSSDCITLSGAGSLLSLTYIPSRRSVAMSYSVTVIPRLTGGSMGRGVSLSSLSLNLSIRSSGGTTDKSTEESREGLSKFKRSSLGPSSVIFTVLSSCVVKIYRRRKSTPMRGRWISQKKPPKKTF